MGTSTGEQENERINAAFEAMIHFEWPGGAIVEWNPEAATLFDWSRAEVLGRSFLETTIAGESRQILKEQLQNLADANEPAKCVRVELKSVRRNDARFPVELIVRTLPTGNGLVFSAAIRDISDRKRDELVQEGQNRVFEMLAGGSSLPEILTALIRIIEFRFDVRASVLLVDTDNKRLRFGSAPSLPDKFNQAVDGLEIGPCSGSCGTAAFRCDTVVIEDIKTDPLWAGFRELGLQTGIRSCWSKPIKAENGKVLGTLCMYYAEARRPRPEEIELMDTTAKLASIAIERRLAMSQLENRGREVEQLQDMLSARDERIKALKHELESLRAALPKSN